MLEENCWAGALKIELNLKILLKNVNHAIKTINYHQIQYTSDYVYFCYATFPNK